MKLCLAALAASLMMFGGLTACGGGGDIDAFVQLDTEKAAAFATGGEDCAAKADAVRAWRTNHNAKYKEMQGKLKDAYPKGPPADVMEKHGEQLEKNKKAVMGAMFACANDEAFGKAIDETAEK